MIININNKYVMKIKFTLCWRYMKSSGGRPTQALKIFIIHCLCDASALITGAPGGTIGALRRYERIDKTLWNRSKCNSSSASIKLATGWGESTHTVILSHNSVKIIKSRISGAANKESSQVLCNTIVF